jgi:hypothetical protein
LPEFFFFDYPGIEYEVNVRMSPRSRVWAKYLILESEAAVIRMQRYGLCVGAVECQAVTVSTPFCSRFFAVALFNVKRISRELLIHESVHIATAYRERYRQGVFHPEADGLPEEQIAYATARAANNVISKLRIERISLPDD